MMESVSAPHRDFTSQLGDLTLEEKVGLLSGAHGFSTAGGVDRLGIPPLRVADSVSGIRGHDLTGDSPTPCFPNTACYGATWDASLLARLGGELARQARIKGVQVVLGPTINIHRDPRGGRNFECLSEDPLLSGQLAGAIVNGLRAQGHGACPKHFVCNDSETLRHYYDVEASVDGRTLREIYLAAWQHLLRTSKPDGVMMAYNKVDGTFCSENEPLIQKVLRGDWGFEGFVMSDWFGVHSTVESVRAGLDLEMPFPVFRAGRLVEAVRSGAVTEDELNDRVLKMLQLRNRVRACLDSKDEKSAIDENTNELARELAEGGIVLLKDDNGALPLDTSATKRLAIIGEYSTNPVLTGGGSASCTPQYKIPPIDLFRERVSNVGHAPGVRTRRIIPVAPTARLVSKDGRAGVDVAFFNDGVSEPVLEEHQDKPEVWMLGEFKPGLLVPGSRLRMTTRLRPATTGMHTLAVRCTGAFDLFVADVRVLSGPAREIPVEQVIFNHIRLESRVQVHMDAGVAYSIRLEMRGPEALVVGEPTPYAATLCFEEAYDEEAAIGDAVALAKHSDVSVIYAGRNEQYESEGYDLDDIALPANQCALIKAVAAVAGTTVLVLHAGNPIDVSEVVDDVDAVLLAHFPGQEGTRAVIDVLTGKVSPSGRLATTWFKTLEDAPSYGDFPATRREDGSVSLRYAEGVQVGYRHPAKEGRIRWPFGFGLSYTQFAYDTLRVAVDEERETSVVSVRVTVQNIGAVAGREVVQVYVTPNSDAAVWRPERELKAFDKVALQPGEARVVEFEIDLEIACSYWDEQVPAWRLEPGTYGIVVGSQTSSFVVTKSSVWNHL